MRRHCEETITDASVDIATSSAYCKEVLNYVASIVGDVDQMDARYFNIDNVPNDAFIELFKHSDRVSEIKEALHVTKPNSFSSSNSTVGERIMDRNEDTAWVFTDLLARGMQVLINVGQFDMKDGVRQTLEWTKKI